jgi:hypothetical protein
VEENGIKQRGIEESSENSMEFMTTIWKNIEINLF